MLTCIVIRFLYQKKLRKGIDVSEFEFARSKLMSSTLIQNAKYGNQKKSTPSDPKVQKIFSFKRKVKEANSISEIPKLDFLQFLQVLIAMPHK